MWGHVRRVSHRSRDQGDDLHPGPGPLHRLHHHHQRGAGGGGVAGPGRDPRALSGEGEQSRGSNH